MVTEYTYHYIYTTIYTPLPYRLWVRCLKIPTPRSPSILASYHRTAVQSSFAESLCQMYYVDLDWLIILNRVFQDRVRVRSVQRPLIVSSVVLEKK